MPVAKNEFEVCLHYAEGLAAWDEGNACMMVASYDAACFEYLAAAACFEEAAKARGDDPRSDDAAKRMCIRAAEAASYRDHGAPPIEESEV